MHNFSVMSVRTQVGKVGVITTSKVALLGFRQGTKRIVISASFMHSCSCAIMQLYDQQASVH